MRDERRNIVRTGYDRAAGDYLARRPSDGGDIALLDRLLAELDASSAVLDAGCGAGVPVTERLMTAGHRVTGVDLSSSQVALARRLVGGASVVQGDLAALPFAPATFDAVVSYYAVIHVPRDEHGRVFDEFRRVLRPGGRALLCLGHSDNPDDHDPGSWMGVPMYWSHYDADTSLALLYDRGLHVAWWRDVRDPMDHGRHRFVLARKAP
jgi:SAM-dependent methyltransferase